MKRILRRIPTRIRVLLTLAALSVLIMGADATACDVRVQPSQGQGSASSTASSSSSTSSRAPGSGESGITTIDINPNGQVGCLTIDTNGSTREAHIRMSARPEDDNQTVLIQAQDNQGNQARVKLESHVPAANATGTTTLVPGAYQVLLNGVPAACIIIRASN